MWLETERGENWGQPGFLEAIRGAGALAIGQACQPEPSPPIVSTPPNFFVVDAATLL